ncbi:F0F1 ATP synthase subunit B [Aureimonas leprariae]|uniref:ATP synthase subunit b n=1 Tax=Plantimonas leprariae TaxID=2615207 RepID=A0A7V7PQC5_9HYPH|nr:F0F1 ATP synthase subunit B [Aureimonas leprariae]KAB0680262.1 ATP F0F1 synthase subunit B [Aureimonas leprariae]
MDNTFWAFVSLVVFFAVVWYFKGFPKMAKSLDDHSVRVRRELEEARLLKEEAKTQLAEYQRRRQEAERDAKEIVASASREAEALLADARRRNEEYVTRRTQMAESKIAQAEADAIAEVKASAIDIAVTAAKKIVAEKGSSGEAGRFIEQSLGEISQRLH